MRYKTFEEWMDKVKNIDVSTLTMATSTWDKYLDEYNAYKKDNEQYISTK